MEWSVPLPAFQKQTFRYTWYALPLRRVWSGRGTAAYWWNMIYLRSDLCTVWHSQPPRTGEVCPEQEFLYVSFLFNFQAFWRIFGWIVIYWNCGPVQVVGLRGHVWKLGKWCFSDPRNPTLKRTWQKACHTHCGQKQGVGSAKTRMEMVGFRSNWLVLGAQTWETVLDTKFSLILPHACKQHCFHVHLQTHFPCCL